MKKLFGRQHAAAIAHQDLEEAEFGRREVDGDAVYFDAMGGNVYQDAGVAKGEFWRLCAGLFALWATPKDRFDAGE
jgi:hypothetical protein